MECSGTIPISLQVSQYTRQHACAANFQCTGNPGASDVSTQCSLASKHLVHICQVKSEHLVKKILVWEEENIDLLIEIPSQKPCLRNQVVNRSSVKTELLQTGEESLQNRQPVPEPYLSPGSE